LKATVAELQEAAAFGKETVGNQRKEVERLYRLAHMSNPSDAIIALIGKASPAELTALAEQYGAKAIGEFSGRCKKCGSNEISMQSATGGDAPVYERAEKTLDEIREQHAKPFFFPTV
jgi:hypothetical protein